MKTLLTLAFLLLQFAQTFAQQISFKTDHFNVYITAQGNVSSLSDIKTGKEYFAKGQEAPLLQIQKGADWQLPTKAVFDKKKNTIALEYAVAKITAEIKVVQNKTHISFELVKLSDINVDAVCWGAFPTNINKTIGEVIGVVRDGNFAIGLQTLNSKTLGGVYKSAGGYDDPARGTTATQKDYGSSLQAYSLNRAKARSVSVWNNQYPDVPVEAIANETTIGSKIALFGCPENQVLATIGKIEVAENLPHPLINGVWMKQSPETGRAYLISDFNETNVYEMLEYTKQAGLVSLYHEGPFESWGHFGLNKASFPNGNAGMKKCVEKATAMGIRIGVHTLSTFINTNDAYVTPIPDKRLAKTGFSALSEDVLANSTEIVVESKKYFENIKPSTLHAVRIGDEIIRFREVTPEAPYKLQDCQRGAYGTKAVNHKKGEEAAMLMDYPYNTLFPNLNLQQEIAGNLGKFFNETGVSHMDFDGHEGCFSSGEGDYAVQTFAEKTVKDTKHTLVNGTSRGSHYYWHICHYWNWGEPWYGGFRESQGDYRLENQPFLERNYMPNMLGWFLLSSTTISEDIEWMMARAAGYNAGFALVARYKSLKENPETPKLLNLINLWQEAYRKKIFSAEQISRLKNPNNDFHLEKSEAGWKLFPFKKHKFSHINQLLQPGQPTFSEWEFENTDTEQPLNFTLTIEGKEGVVTNPTIEIDGYFRLDLEGDFEAGNTVVCDGETIKLYNSKGKYVKDIPSSKKTPTLKTGKHKVKFDCQFTADSELKNRFIIKTISKPDIM